jgi:hypothetical protein
MTESRTIDHGGGARTGYIAGQTYNVEEPLAAQFLDVGSALNADPPPADPPEDSSKPNWEEV